MKLFLFLITIFVILIVFFVTIKPLIAAAKVVLLVSQEFPQVPFKPLYNITQKPKIEKVRIGKKIIADFFIPHNTIKKPALIVAMGVKTSDKDRPILLGFCNTLARLGYVVLLPRSEDLEKDIIEFEESRTFVDAFSYLEKQDYVDKNRISYVGLSVGSSLSLVATEDKKINEKVRSIVFFGGYYNISDYLLSLYSKELVLDKKTIQWQPAKGAIDQTQEILKIEGLTLEQFDKRDTLDTDLKKRLFRFSPDQNINSLKAKVFILHEKSDAFVPYTESIKLKQALEKSGSSPIYHQANLFEHVQPKKGISYEVIKEFLGLFIFLHKVFTYL